MHHHMQLKGNFVKNFENSSKANLIENVNHVMNDAADPCASVGVSATVSKTASTDKPQQLHS